MSSPEADLILYGPPRTSTVLAISPRLATWDAKTHPSRGRMAAYLDDIDKLVSWPSGEADRLALRLDVGFPAGAPLIGAGGDLDNYLNPVVAHRGPRRFVSAWATKSHGGSTIGVDAAEPMETSLDDSWMHQRARTTVTSTSRAWKEQIAQQVVPAETGTAGVELHVAYRVHSERNWAELWKPTIDSLGAVLGEGPRPFHPRDDRIVLLGLHRTIDDAIGWDIDIEFWVRPAAY